MAVPTHTSAAPLRQSYPCTYRLCYFFFDNHRTFKRLKRPLRAYSARQTTFPVALGRGGEGGIYRYNTIVIVH